MVERPSRGTFAGLHVFPGGKVDAADAIDDALSRELTDRAASRKLGVAQGGLAYWIAAIREAFEEAGVLLAYRGEGLVELYDDSIKSRFDARRRAVVAGEMEFAELCVAENLALATDRVHYFSHWITPIGAPARFDTRFFVAEMPSSQSVRLYEGELLGSQWIAPRDALDQHRRGRWQMIHPTLTTLETLANYEDLRRLLEDVSQWRHLPEVTDERVRQGMQRQPR